jgi:hypothetical protein
MPRRRSLLETSFIFLIIYTIISLIIYEYHATYLLTIHEPDMINSDIGSGRGIGMGQFQRLIPLTAHLFINGTLAPVTFEIAQRIPKPNDGTSGPRKTQTITPFPVVDEYPEMDPFLPWIHDIFPSNDFSKVIVISQNRRRCHTGKGHEQTMKFLEPQIALFQPISLKHQNSSHQDSNHDHDQVKQHHTEYTISNDEDAIIKETRFQCRFKLYHNSKLIQEQTTFSQYPFNYEYTTWRKRVDAMFETTGKGMGQFWLSSLEFHCPIPPSIRGRGEIKENEELYLDIATIRTPVRKESEWCLKEVGNEMWNVYKEWGRNVPVPDVDKSTRWENIYIPIKFSSVNRQEQPPAPKPYQLVACTWTSAAHNRRGDAVTISDGKDRLREWIAFNLLVGFDHIFVYDNSVANTNETSLKEVTELFDPMHVTHINWPCKICNNNRPVHGESFLFVLLLGFILSISPSRS